MPARERAISRRASSNRPAIASSTARSPATSRMRDPVAVELAAQLCAARRASGTGVGPVPSPQAMNPAASDASNPLPARRAGEHALGRRVGALDVAPSIQASSQRR